MTTCGIIIIFLIKIWLSFPFGWSVKSKRYTEIFFSNFMITTPLPLQYNILSHSCWRVIAHVYCYKEQSSKLPPLDLHIGKTVVARNKICCSDNVGPWLLGQIPFFFIGAPQIRLHLPVLLYFWSSSSHSGSKKVTVGISVLTYLFMFNGNFLW